MCSGSATRAVVTVALFSALLGGCSEYYFDRRDTITLHSGETMAANRVTHVIDPWSPASGQRNIAYNGEKAAMASERYRTGRIIPPVNATTSSAAYTQASSAPNAGSSNSNSPTK